MVSFTGRDSISLLSFLESYYTSCDHSHFNEGHSIHILPYVIEVNPKQTVTAYMRHRSVSYPDVFNFLLDKYASNETIIQTQDAIKNLQQLPNQCASDFDDYIRSRNNAVALAVR